MSSSAFYENDYNLLVIDDEIEITKSLIRQFRRKYNVFSANSGEEAIKLMDNHDIHVVISDQRMPGLTGVEFFSKVKDKYKDTLRLILTGYSDIQAVIDAINKGHVYRYVTKPWIPNELDSIVNEAFEKYNLVMKNRRLMMDLEQANATLEEKVQQRTRELEELNHLKNKYIGIVAHDLRNPIGIAKSFSVLLLEDYDNYTKPEHLEFIGIISERCSYSLNLMHDFLDISKIESGIFEVDLLEQDYITFLEKAIQQTSILANGKSQTIQFLHPMQQLVFPFDRDKLEQVIGNLLNNAIKYSEPNTLITVDVSYNNEVITTKIIDEGLGIRQEELDKIFHPFETTSTKATAKEKSTGLGLAIVKKIVEAHKGKISVESQLGVGTTFTICFNCANPRKFEAC
ncbi:MAG: hybrid sensor histidine kinase/response regulator [Bacteroidetes bacterium]|nr:hybrid sensor histidine kinase/response regulator [Bacteroidota bacterium]